MLYLQRDWGSISKKPWANRRVTVGITKFNFCFLTTYVAILLSIFDFYSMTGCEYITDYTSLSLAFWRKKTEENAPHSGIHTMFLNLCINHILSCFRGVIGYNKWYFSSVQGSTHMMPTAVFYPLNFDHQNDLQTVPIFRMKNCCTLCIDANTENDTIYTRHVNHRLWWFGNTKLNLMRRLKRSWRLTENTEERTCFWQVKGVKIEDRPQRQKSSGEIVVRE